MAANFYRTEDSPRFYLGHGLELGFISAGIIAAVALTLIYGAINKQRQRQVDAGEHLVMSPKELTDMGDKAMTFRYAY